MKALFEIMCSEMLATELGIAKTYSMGLENYEYANADYGDTNNEDTNINEDTNNELVFCRFLIILAAIFGQFSAPLFDIFRRSSAILGNFWRSSF